MIDNITRADIEQTREQLLDGLQFAQHRLKEFQIQAAFGGDEQPMIDETAKIARIEAKLTGLGYGLVKVEQNERAAVSALRIAERKAVVDELGTAMEQHVSALGELDEMVTQLLPLADRIGSLAADIDKTSGELFPASGSGWMAGTTPHDSFLRAAGVLQVPDVSKTLQSLADFARRVAVDRDRALPKLAVVSAED